MNQLRQGDVLLQPVDRLPDGLEEITGPVILARGEATGHAHVITLPETERHKVRYWNGGAERYIQALERVTVTHEEHAPIVLEPGIYKQGFQVEDFGTEVRRVKD